MVIERDWYELGQWELDGTGHCLNCGYQLPGMFQGEAGNWGAKRLPVRLSDYVQ